MLRVIAIRQKLREPSLWDVIDSFVSRTLSSFNYPFATITSLPEFDLRHRGFTLLAQTKQVISMSYGSSTSSEGPWK